ncbi:hypothetical protein BGZ54_008490 [Gamsiella multidivaricata]|nr:hypothetical protein BGZ54_008490 [Gamsiella multidivaricata]
MSASHPRPRCGLRSRSSPSASKPSFKPFITRSAILILSVLSLLTPAAADPDPTRTITLSYLDESGALIDQPQTIHFADCLALVTSLLESTEGVYSSVSASDPQAALNLYEDQFCQILTSSAVGRWNNVSPVANMVAIRWEGTAPADMTPGTLSPNAFPKEMTVQTQGPDPDADPVVFVMDPSRGRLVVGLVAAVLVVGVLIGVYKVYVAAQFTPPPKKPKKEKKPKGLNTKKIKKKDAYFKKPDRNDQQSFQRLNNDSPEPYSIRPLMTERGIRDSQLSEAATFVDWNQQKSGNNRINGPDSVAIDMHETTGARPSPLHVQSGSSTLNLIHFDSDTSTVGGPGNSNSSHNRGRGGEVLVPMHTFESNYQHPHQQQFHRRSSSSRSR